MANVGGTCLVCEAGPPASEDRSLRDQVTDRTTQALFGVRWTTEDLMKQRAIMAPHFRFSGYVGRVSLRKRLLPALDRLFARARPTALVCATDIEGLVCLDYLENRGLRVPRDVAVVGFDDSIEASMWRLTSYSFGEPALVRAMMMHLLGMGWVRSHRSRTGRTVVPGHVVERETS
jgi:DNA-binding LacI/PurR family transcriptional regulator